MQAPQQPDINHTLTSILQELRRQNKTDNLWGVEEIADYLRLKVTTVRSRVILIPTFPKAIRIPTTDQGGHRRWVPKEIKAWALRWREVEQ